MCLRVESLVLNALLPSVHPDQPRAFIAAAPGFVVSTHDLRHNDHVQRISLLDKQATRQNVIHDHSFCGFVVCS